jgi:hypothetical protein
MFLPLLALAGWAFGGARWRAYIPYVLLLAGYLAIDLTVNSRNYVVTGGHYGIGVHAVTNMLEYIVAMLVGRHNMTNYALIAGGIAVLLLRGNRRVVFATAWMVLALLPFVFFRWANTSRYMYLPAMGLSMLAADGVMQIDRLLARKAPRAWSTAAAALVAAAIAWRFGVYGVSNVRRFADRTEDYRRDITAFKQAHGPLAPQSRVPMAPLSTDRHAFQFLNALVQWEYRDPTITLIPDRPQ